MSNVLPKHGWPCYKVRHFKPKEFECHCGCGAGDIAVLLVVWLDFLRRAWEEPIIVTSGVRCERHNAEVGGAKNSRHLIGCAADIRPRSPAKLPAFKRTVRAMTAFLKEEGWEVIEYPSFVHVAVPRSETERRWSGKAIPYRSALPEEVKNAIVRNTTV